jgi:hypothetical protein
MSKWGLRFTIEPQMIRPSLRRRESRRRDYCSAIEGSVTLAPLRDASGGDVAAVWCRGDVEWPLDSNAEAGCAPKKKNGADHCF